MTSRRRPAPEVLLIDEAAPPQAVELPVEVAMELGRLGICDVVPSALPGIWTVQNVRKVGVLRVGALEVVIRPKVTIRNLLWMLSVAGDGILWREDDVGALQGDSLTDALARAYARVLERATAGGLRRSYRQVDEASQVIRGRWDVGRQLRVRRGALMPAEITFDEFDVDTDENRILLAALVRLLRLPGISVGAAVRLRTLVARFEGVQTIRPWERDLTWRRSRLNRHLEPALRLARVILLRRGIEHATGPVGGVAFLVTMSSVFERFVERVVRAGAEELGLVVGAQHEVPFDREGRARVRPDVTLYRGTVPIVVLDAKYKQEKPSGFPNADLYQALSYAIRYRLSEAYLIYAAGLGEPAHHVVDEVEITVRCLTLDLLAEPAAILEQINNVVRDAAMRAAAGSDTASIAGC